MLTFSFAYLPSIGVGPPDFCRRPERFCYFCDPPVQAILLGVQKLLFRRSETRKTRGHHWPGGAVRSQKCANRQCETLISQIHLLNRSSCSFDLANLTVLKLSGGDFCVFRTATKTAIPYGTLANFIHPDPQELPRPEN